MNRAEALKLLKQVSEDFINPILNAYTLIHLCEFYLEELHLFNDLDILKEIEPVVERLFKFSEDQRLYGYLAEAKLLQAKIALIQLNFGEAQRLLTQAQRMAKQYGYKLLADEIAGLHEAMMEKKDTWEQMEKSNAPISERMDLARLDDHLKGKFRMHMMRLERSVESPPKKEVF